MRSAVAIAAAVVMFGFFNYSIYRMEDLKANGTTMLVELAPRDPLSLIQGYYMQLGFAIERDLEDSDPDRGQVVVRPDADNVAEFVRHYRGEPLNEGERLLRYRRRGTRMQIVPDSYLFQEGHAEAYQQARYAIFQFGDVGSYILVGLADETRQPIRPAEAGLMDPS